MAQVGEGLGGGDNVWNKVNTANISFIARAMK